MLTRVSRFVLGIIVFMTSFAGTQPQPQGTCSGFNVSRDPLETLSVGACLDGPVFGFTLNPVTGRLHPIRGIAGALRLDDPIELGFELDTAQFSDKQAGAVVVSRGDRNVLSLRFHGNTVYVREVGLPADPARISLSSTGDFAAVFYPTLRKIFVVSLRSTAALSWIADASIFPDEVIELGISDDGAQVLAGAARGTVYLFTNKGVGEPVATTTAPGIIRFLKNSHDAVFADASETRLYYYSESARAAWGLAFDGGGGLSPLDIAVSSANDRVFVVNRDSGTIFVISLETGQSTAVDCNCVPRGLESLQGGDAFAITRVTDSSLLLFQPTAAGGEIHFVPILRSTDSGVN